MRHHAKAESAGSTMRQASGLGRILRGVFAGHGVSIGENGRGAPSLGWLRAPLIASLLAASVFFLSASSALAGELAVTLGGSGTGAVSGGSSANPDVIDCSNIAGEEQAACAFNFPFAFPLPVVTLEATGGPGAIFVGWTGTNAGSCNSGNANPCSFNSALAATVEATFAPPPNPVQVATDPASDIDDFGATLRGRVNPMGSAVDGCRFEYGITADYGASLPCTPRASELGEESEFIDVSADLPPVEPGTEYHYRLVASNPSGVVTGGDATFVTTGTPCPNAEIRAAQGIGTVLLPGCMALEMVDPGKKGSAPVAKPEISANAERILFRSKAAFAGTPVLSELLPTPYVATRDAEDGHWRTSATTPTEPSLNQVWEAGVAATGFSPSLASWFDVLSFGNQPSQGIGQAFTGGTDQPIAPLSPQFAPVNEGTITPSEYNSSLFNMRFWGASGDNSHLFFTTFRFGGAGGVAYLPGDPTGSSSENTYVARLTDEGAPSLELVARDRDGKIWGGSCGALIGGALDGNSEFRQGARNQGAISTDGTRVYVTARPAQSFAGTCDKTVNKRRILERVEGPTGPVITQLISSECTRVSPACGSFDGDDNFQGASVDGTKVYFTTNRQLADSDQDGSATACSPTTAVSGCDLYLYDAAKPVGERLTQVSAGESVGAHEAGKEARVLDQITAISGDGSHAYFVAEGALTGPNVDGASPLTAAGARNLYAWEIDAAHPGGKLTFVATVSGSDGATSAVVPGLWGSQGTFRNTAYPVPATGERNGVEVGGDGHVLVFESEASLTADDTDGGFIDVYRYDADSGQLQRISKAAADGSDNGAFSVVKRNVQAPAGPDLTQAGRWVSEDGDTIVFDTAEGLIPGDVNGLFDFYVWRQGQLARLPGQQPGQFGFFSGAVGSQDVVLAPTGDSIGFTSTSRLLPEDGDSTESVYVARVDGGFPLRPAAEPCVGEGCQEPFSTQPDDQGTASEAPTAGNLSARPNCAARARRARKLSQRAKRLRKLARRIEAPAPTRHLRKRARYLRKRAKRLGKRAAGFSRNAKRCRHANRGRAR